MSHHVDWGKLIRQLPKQAQRTVERTIRRSLKRRLGQIRTLDTSVTPDSVRSQAIHTWRKRYMKGASKSAKRRMGYARLRDDEDYRQIERELLQEYWESRLAMLPGAEQVDDLPLQELCDAYRATNPTLGGTVLDGLMREVLARIYADTDAATQVQRNIADRVCRIVRTKQLHSYAYVYDDEPGIRRSSRKWAFDLYGVTSEDEVSQRVRKAHVVERVVGAEFGKRPMYLIARDAIVNMVGSRCASRAVSSLVCELVGESAETHDPMRTILERLAKEDARAIEAYLRGEDFFGRVVHELLANPHYEAQYRRSRELLLRVRENVPPTPMEAYPLARTMQRHVVLHVGPTNSGKTHDALQVLAQAQSGAYLGPLRLLAYEQFEELNRMGCVCSLLTGEESVELAGARHVSSTVEMASFDTQIDVAVIDEAQMIADKTRGHHWTEAILGIPASVIHVCCAPQAAQAVQDLVALCDDTLEVVHHQRLVPLRAASGGFRLPQDVEPGDALVVFSRKSVHSVAAQVAAMGFRPSVIYGALPHDVRHEEARRFDAGETDVVVATDAIGMGMNLPIRRVVFVEQEKFDGYATRLLRPEEVQQIAGRAGRFGRYEIGYYTSTRMRRDMRRRCLCEVAPIASVPVGIPANIALVRDATLSDCIRQWMTIEQPKPFKRIDIDRDISLIREVESMLDEERQTNVGDKLLVLSLATMAFDERDRELHRTWRRMARSELEGTQLEFEVPDAPANNASLVELEAQYRYCDLLYTYARTFGHKGRLEPLSNLRNQISRAIMRMLAGASTAR